MKQWYALYVLLCSYGLTLIPAWISNYIHYKVWDEITYPFLNFNGAEIWMVFFFSIFNNSFEFIIVLIPIDRAWYVSTFISSIVIGVTEWATLPTSAARLDGYLRLYLAAILSLVGCTSEILLRQVTTIIESIDSRIDLGVLDCSAVRYLKTIRVLGRRVGRQTDRRVDKQADMQTDRLYSKYLFANTANFCTVP